MAILVEQGQCPCDKVNNGRGSSDAFTTYDDGGYYCFRCNNEYVPKGFTVGQNKIEKPTDSGQKKTDPVTSERWKNSKIAAFKERGLDKDTVKRYNCRVYVDDMARESDYFFPAYNNEGVVKGAKRKNTTGELPKSYISFGETHHTLLFGQSLFPSGGKYVTVFEGELDAMSGWQMLRNAKAPDPVCVSVRHGTGSIASHVRNEAVIKYLNSFDEIRICFDMDEPGRDGAKKLRDALDKTKTKIVKLPTGYKDANAMLLDGKKAEFINSWWRAEIIIPQSVYTFEQAWDKHVEAGDIVSYPYPWDDLNNYVYGARMHESTVITAQTGVGKSQFLKEVGKHFFDTTEHNIGFVTLEEPPAKSALGLVSTFADQPLHLPDTVYDSDRVERIAREISESQRIFYAGDFGASDEDGVLHQINFLVKSMNCKFIFLDHISMLTSEHVQLDERKALDAIATKLQKSLNEYAYHLHCVAHLNRMDEIRGSANIEKLADTVLHFERNIVDTDHNSRNTTTVTVRKNRFAGKTGVAGYLRYVPETGRMVKGSAPNEDI